MVFFNIDLGVVADNAVPNWTGLFITSVNFDRTTEVLKCLKIGMYMGEEKTIVIGMQN